MPRFIALFGPADFAGGIPGLPGPQEVARRIPRDAGELLAEMANEGLVLVVLHHDEVGVLPMVLAARSRPTTPGPVPAPIVVVGCPDAEAASGAVAAGADHALRHDALGAEAQGIIRAAMRSRDLSELVLKDDLTAAWNRRYFEQFLRDELERARRDGQPLSLIFMDIDNLKAVNVRHGHSMGSHVLREVALRLMRTVRSSDAVMRYGGDEFCVILPGLALQDAVEVAERLREAIARDPFEVERSGQVRLTASFGIATHPQHAQDLQSLVAAADAAMLSIKDRQKNGISVAGVA